MTFDKELKESWFLPNRESFSGLKEYMSIAVPAMFMIVFEFASFEIMNFMAGYITVDNMGANIMLTNICSFMYMFSLGF